MCQIFRREILTLPRLRGGSERPVTRQAQHPDTSRERTVTGDVMDFKVFEWVGWRDAASSAEGMADPSFA
jgi:hypothetical protein